MKGRQEVILEAEERTIILLEWPYNFFPPKRCLVDAGGSARRWQCARPLTPGTPPSLLGTGDLGRGAYRWTDPP